MTVHLALQGAIPGSPGRVRRALHKAGVRRWLYLGIDSAWRLRAERTILAGVPSVDIGERAALLAEELRGPFLNAIGELSKLNASLEWWASELAAKNPHNGLFSRLCALGGMDEALAADAAGTLVVCDTPALLEEALYAAHRGGHGAAVLWGPASISWRAAEAVRAITWRSLAALGERGPASVRVLPGRLSDAARQAVEEAPGHRRRTLTDLGATPESNFSGEDTVLIVTWADKRNIGSDGSYVDPHVGQLPEFLRERGKRIALMPRILPTAGFEECARELLRTGEHLVFPDLYVGAAAWRRCVERARSFEPQIPDDASVGPIPLARLAAEEIRATDEARAAALAYEPIVQNLTAAGVEPGRIVFPFEGHAWEQAMTWSIHRHMPGTEVIGYDNVNFSRLALSLYPARSEIGLRPLPDRVVTNGPAFHRILVEEGFPKDAVRTGCALRHSYLWERAPAPAGDARRGGTTRVLVATSIGLAQSVELIEKALAAFGGQSSYEVVIKCHPAVDVTAVRRWTRGIEPHANARFADAPISELLEASDVMLYTYSVVCYEALAHGVPPVFVRSESSLDLDQLEPFPGVRWVARTPDQLRRATEEIAALTEPARRSWSERAGSVVREALAPLGPGCVDPFLD